MLISCTMGLYFKCLFETVPHAKQFASKFVEDFVINKHAEQSVIFLFV